MKLEQNGVETRSIHLEYLCVFVWNKMVKQEKKTAN